MGVGGGGGRERFLAVKETERGGGGDLEGVSKNDK